MATSIRQAPPINLAHLDSLNLKELQQLKKTLDEDANELEYYQEQFMSHLQGYRNVERVTVDQSEQNNMDARQVNRDLHLVNDKIKALSKATKSAAISSIAARDVVPPSLDKLLDILNGTYIINPIFDKVATNTGLSKKGYLKPDKLKAIINYYKNKIPVLRQDIVSIIHTLKKPTLISTLNKFNEHDMVPTHVVKSSTNNDSKKALIINIIDKEILLDPSKRGTKTTDGRRRIVLPSRAINTIRSFINEKGGKKKIKTKKSGVFNLRSR
tara:strand:- start:140 stop:949 length:810 start_codon:yes stop_codon:yes gene_type:complete